MAACRLVAQPPWAHVSSGRCCPGPHRAPGAIRSGAHSLQTHHRLLGSSPAGQKAHAYDWSHRQSSPSALRVGLDLQTSHDANRPFAPIAQSRLYALAIAGVSDAAAESSTTPGPIATVL